MASQLYRLHCMSSIPNDEVDVNPADLPDSGRGVVVVLGGELKSFDSREQEHGLVPVRWVAASHVL